MKTDPRAPVFPGGTGSDFRVVEAPATRSGNANSMTLFLYPVGCRSLVLCAAAGLQGSARPPWTTARRRVPVTSVRIHLRQKGSQCRHHHVRVFTSRDGPFW